MDIQEQSGDAIEIKETDYPNNSEPDEPAPIEKPLKQDKRKKKNLDPEKRSKQLEQLKRARERKRELSAARKAKQKEIEDKVKQQMVSSNNENKENIDNLPNDKANKKRTMNGARSAPLMPIHEANREQKEEEEENPYDGDVDIQFELEDDIPEEYGRHPPRITRPLAKPRGNHNRKRERLSSYNNSQSQHYPGMPISYADSAYNYANENTQYNNYTRPVYDSYSYDSAPQGAYNNYSTIPEAPSQNHRSQRLSQLHNQIFGMH